MEFILILIPIAASVGLGFAPAGRLRNAVIWMLWLAPLWLAVWMTLAFPEKFEFEFGSRWFPFFHVPLFLTLWGVVTLFPFKLTVRIREINRGIF
ncbi:hypothetical protein M2336_001403 [Sphingobium sp. B1D7B]|uniref:hypothetical protein n=1 Tax=Sphingobium sp. B11D3A TaxID=2940574 RepID=UPI002224504D|nr:hypothetical protein [Sphingobium sp. B11D3A]MCW2404774.1 hypothetical protein [Sphingobium sp. B1D7B]